VTARRLCPRKPLTSPGSHITDRWFGKPVRGEHTCNKSRCPQSPYQALLLAKICLVAVMIGLAIVNRYVLAPHLQSVPDDLHRLRFSTIGEVVLGLCAVGVVSILGTLAPT
jgi:Copper resistance protein D